MSKATSTCCLILLTAASFSQTVKTKDLKDHFKTPPFEYRPFFPFQGAAATDHLGVENTQEQLEKIYLTYGFGGIMIAPASDKPFTGNKVLTPSYMQHVGSGLQATLPPGASPWLMTLAPGAKTYRELMPPETAENKPKLVPLPPYMSPQYFSTLKETLAFSKKNGRKVIFYDEVGYPSGIANHSTPEKFHRKLLEKNEELISGAIAVSKPMNTKDQLLAVVAMNVATRERIDLAPFLQNNTLKWKAPAGTWKLMTFTCVTATSTGHELDYRSAIDYMDADAVNWFVNKVYDPHAKEVGNYFGNTIIQTFFDDVGIFDEERTWTGKFNEKFRLRYGKNPAIYYPALWENIGPETDAARVAFFDTRAELLADGFPKIVTDWGTKHNVLVSGHCPGNYDPQPVDMNGDPFKFYRAQPIPMVDVIFSYPTGRDGFKLVSDGADYYDKPIVASENFSSFSPPGQTAGYRRLMELFVRGVNRLMGSGFPVSDVYGGPTTFAEWVGRSCMMLQGGKRISEIAIFYPIADLEAFYHFDAKEYTKDMRWGTFVPHDNDFLAVGEMLLGHVHRDFTFMHPDFLLSDKMRINGSALQLQNKENSQTYKVLILPGQTVISLQALKKIKAYYDEGGVVVATSLLPSKAAELAGSEKATLTNNQHVQSIIKEIFGIDPAEKMPEGISAIKTNKKNGKAIFIKTPSGPLLAETLNKLQIPTDVAFDKNPAPSSGGGMFSYTHKKKDGRDIYFFANSSDDAVSTVAEVRGKISPELWDPATGITTKISQVEHLKKGGQDYTRFPLTLGAVRSVFVVSGN